MFATGVTTDLAERIIINDTCLVDPLGRPTVTVGRDHCFCTCHPSVPTIHNLAKQNTAKTMFATGQTVGLAEWIIDDTCLVKLVILISPGLSSCYLFHLLFDVSTKIIMGHFALKSLC